MEAGLLVLMAVRMVAPTIGAIGDEMQEKRKIPVWISSDAHKLLRRHCEKTGESGIAVLSSIVEESLGSKKSVEKNIEGDQNLGGVWIV